MNRMTAMMMLCMDTAMPMPMMCRACHAHLLPALHQQGRCCRKDYAQS